MCVQGSWLGFLLVPEQDPLMSPAPTWPGRPPGELAVPRTVWAFKSRPFYLKKKSVLDTQKI